MPSTWTSPVTWNPGQVVAASDLNAQLRDNLIYLFARPQNVVKRDNGANYTTTSTSFVDIDGTNLKITLNISGGAVLLGFTGVAVGGSIVTNAGPAAFDFLIDSTRYASAGTDGLVANANTAYWNGVSMAALVTGLSAGSHTFKVQWKFLGVGTSSVLCAGNGTGGQDFIPTFWAIEVG
jgi:hypothetical protein